MCKHCVNLVEDKEVVHRFFEVGAMRLNEILPKRIGMPLHRPVTADDIESPILTVHATFWRENHMASAPAYGPNREDSTAQIEVMRMLDEMDDSGYYRRAPSAEEQMRRYKDDPEITKRLEALLSEMVNSPIVKDEK